MTDPTYILATRRGCRMLAFDDLARARAEKARSEKRTGIALDIIKQTIVEEIVT